MARPYRLTIEAAASQNTVELGGVPLTRFVMKHGAGAIRMKMQILYGTTRGYTTKIAGSIAIWFAVSVSRSSRGARTDACYIFATLEPRPR
jgi:hypothetical protein